MTAITNLISADNPLSGSSGYYEAGIGQLTEKLNRISANAVKTYKEVFLKYNATAFIMNFFSLCLIPSVSVLSLGVIVSIPTKMLMAAMTISVIAVMYLYKANPIEDARTNTFSIYFKRNKNSSIDETNAVLDEQRQVLDLLRHESLRSCNVFFKKYFQISQEGQLELVHPFDKIMPETRLR
ncbi:MAG: hypothetical protein PVI40_06220 [Chlamydiota bacterium]|jgi:hypothetical protein